MSQESKAICSLLQITGPRDPPQGTPNHMITHNHTKRPFQKSIIRNRQFIQKEGGITQNHKLSPTVIISHQKSSHQTHISEMPNQESALHTKRGGMTELVCFKAWWKFSHSIGTCTLAK